MPRLQPPEGLITSAEATKILGISDGMLYLYVKQGRLKRHGPEGRKQKFYRLDEVQSLKESLTVFRPAYIRGQWRDNPTTTFEPARPEDIPTIVAIDGRIFGDEEPVEEKWYASWLHKNPESFFVLRDRTGAVKAYVCLLPVKRHTLDRFLRDEIGMDAISEDDVELWEPGHPLHVYIIAMGVDPLCSRVDKRQYGSKMVREVLNLLNQMGDRGVEIETVTARSYKTDGKKLLHGIGIPQLRSPNPDKELFSIRVSDSGLWYLIEYSNKLEQWKREHQR